MKPGGAAVAARRQLANDPIVVTGMGVWAAGTRSPEALYAAALGGRSTAVWLDLPGPIGVMRIAACRAPDIDLETSELRVARRLDRVALLAFLAGLDAWRDSGLADDPGVDPARVGVFSGMSRGPIAKGLEAAAAFEHGTLRPSSSADSTLTSVNGVISYGIGARGPSASVVATCASAAVAIGVAATHLMVGEADVVVAGGAEAAIVPLMCAQLDTAGVVGHHEEAELTCRPFDVRRNGMVIGDGAGFLVLERSSSARVRGRVPYARLAGWGYGVDTTSRVGITPRGEGLVRVARHALDTGDLSPRDIGYVNAHGTGTRLNDTAESAALIDLFGHGAVPPTSSTKPITGHCMGATPALEAIIAILAMRNANLPPTANLEQPDPACELDHIRDSPRQAIVDAVLSTSLGFWGMQGALVFTRP